jgi:hypothetical protein
MTGPGFTRHRDGPPDADVTKTNGPLPVAEDAPVAAKGKKPRPTWRDFAISAPDLCDEKFPEVQYLVPGLIPEGVMLLVGRPKLGKSWLLLQIASAVAQGTITLISDSDTPPACGDVLHLSLEDGKQRLQRRMTKYFGALRSNWPARMTIVPIWRRLDQGGIDDIRDWCRSVPNPTLVTIDTLKKIRPPAKATETNYACDYEANEKLVELAHEFPGLAIIVAHHDRKMEAEDPFDTISGTLGLTGGVDTIGLLKRSGQGITLHIQGRDLVDSVEKAVHLDRETCRWVILGEAKDVQRSKEWRLVLDALRTAGLNGLTVKAIMDQTELRPRNKVDLLLGRMVREGAIERRERGIYAVPGADLLTGIGGP